MRGEEKQQVNGEVVYLLEEGEAREGIKVVCKRSY